VLCYMCAGDSDHLYTSVPHCMHFERTGRGTKVVLSKNADTKVL